MSSQSKNQLVHNRFNGASSDPIVEDRLAAVLQSLYHLHSKEIDLGLNRAYRFLERLGSPHLRLPRTVHVAGTNGKGSTIATLRALLEASGQTVHTYTSPHLVHPTERIVLAGAPISSEALLDLLTECIEINNGEPITFFELFTCAALLAYARTPADYLLLETGMGGRLDTTNVIDAPVATIITAISMDHTTFLGNTLAEIAAEKAGIMKAGAPCIIGYQFPEAIEAGVLDVFQQKATELSPNAPLLIHGAGWCTASESNLMLFRYEDDSIRLPKPRLPGNHQLWNAGAALAAFRVIEPGHFTPEILSTAMANIYWPGRMQTLENHWLNAALPASWDIVIDGAHNDTGGIILADQMKEWTDRPDAFPIHLIVAMVDRKDPRAFLKPLLPFAASLTVTEITGEPTTYKTAALAAIAHEMGFKDIVESPDVEAAVRVAASKGGAKARIVIAGSLFLMGNVLGSQ